VIGVDARIRSALPGPDDRGSAGPLFALVLFFLGAALGGACLVVGRSMDISRRSEARQAVAAKLWKAVAEAAEALGVDATPESDGPGDLARLPLSSREDGVSLVVEDLSSRLNPNLVSRELLETPELRSLVAPSSSPASLAAYRREAGLSTELEHYGAFLREGSEKFWSGFGRASLEVDDPDSLAELYLALTGSGAAAAAFSLRLSAARGLGRAIDADAAEELLGDACADAGSVIGGDPPYNVNFAPEPVLRGVLALPKLGMPEASSRADAILAARALRDISGSELAAILGVPSDGGSRARIFGYLGVRTWFWSIEAEAQGRTLAIVVAACPARGPEVDRGGRRRLVVAEARLSP